MTHVELTPLSRDRDRQLVDIAAACRALDLATTPAEIRQVEAKLDAVERYMRETGLYDTEEIRPLNEARMRARWKLGRALAEMDRQQVIGPGRGKVGGKTTLSESTSFRVYIKEVGLDPRTALEAQRIGEMPEHELEKALAARRAKGELCTLSMLLIVARPHWYQASRAAKHASIAATAEAKRGDDPLGPFPLIYADPPWKFETYSPKGLGRTPDQHYPTLSDAEIKSFRVGAKLVKWIAHKDAALFLWCTSSNLLRALDVMKEWGFSYKTHAVWVKGRGGTALVFSNWHEVLLYGTRGAMPGPQFQPPSVFQYPRGRHSAKPPQIREAIQRMYPDFDCRTRLELFARERFAGWDAWGNEVPGAAP